MVLKNALFNPINANLDSCKMTEKNAKDGQRQRTEVAKQIKNIWSTER